MLKSYFKGIRKVLLNELDNATEKIVVAVYWFTNLDLFKKIIEKLEKGIQVEIIIHNDYINNRTTGLNFQKFIDKGGEFFFSAMSNPMHNKFCVIDNKVLINGSYNWTYYAEDRNSENILLIKEENDVINSFVEEFEKLKQQMVKIDTITPLTSSDISKYKLSNAEEYLAYDMVLQSASIGNINMVEEAFLLAPKNIEVQKSAYNLNLINKYKLKDSIGASLHGDKYLILAPKGSSIPFINSKEVGTVYDNQKTIESRIYYGDNKAKASKNVYKTKMRVTGLPPKPAGVAKIKCDLTIDINGNLRIEIFSLDNGKKMLYPNNISNLLIPNAFSEKLILTVDEIKGNLLRYGKMANNYNKEDSKELKMNIIEQINLVADLCTSLDQANVLLSVQERDKEYSLLGIRKKYIHSLNQKYIDIDNALLELHNTLYKKFSSFS